MAKNIVICSDGTGNSTIKGRGTNVFKLFEAVDLNGHRLDPSLTPQVAFYDDGVGTEDFKPLKVLGGVTGFGLGRNVRQLYRELARVYDPGDRIFLFGFSRGAFTVRTLGGFITRCGILDVSRLRDTRELERMVRKAYRAYRRLYRTALSQMIFPKRDVTAIHRRFRDDHCLPGDVPIAFIGVWDTVDAVGMPFHIADVINSTVYRFKFTSRDLNPLVERACHALALDDERHSFHPLLWTESPTDKDRIEQVWFAGAHSNVGGGYPKQGMSLVALEWMMRNAEAAGLRFVTTDGDGWRDHANVDDKLYDPRAGVGIFYRWKPRDVANLCTRSGVEPAVHISAVERIAHGTEDYAPGNVPPKSKVVITPTRVPEQDTMLLTRAKELEKALEQSHPDPESLLARVRSELAVGRASYYVYLGSCVAVIVAALVTQGVSAFTTLSVTALLRVVARTMITLFREPALFWTIVGGFALAYCMALFTDTRMNRTFSSFWFRTQPKLRNAMKAARAACAATVAAVGPGPRDGASPGPPIAVPRPPVVGVGPAPTP